MNQYSQLRNQIRKMLAEEYSFGTQMEDESEFDLSAFDSAISTLDQRKISQEKRLNAMKKQLGIPSHPDNTINRMMKRTQQVQMDDIEDDIKSSEDNEEDLTQAKDEFDTIQKQNQEYKEKMDQVSQLQTQTGSGSDITGM